MPTVLITGGSGTIGTALSHQLVQRNYDVIILSREPGKHSLHDDKGTGHGKISYAGWDIAGQVIDADAIKQADYIVHLAGADVAGKRWTAKRKKEIQDSRVKSGELIVKALKENPNKVKAVLSSLGTGWYGPDPVIPNPSPFKETDPPHDDFLGVTCRLWQEALAPVKDLNKRFVVLRTGVVLSETGGALEKFKLPVKFGLAAFLGSGKQVISWIHVEDLARLYVAAIENENFNGAYNAVAPEPVSNKNFMLLLARIKKGKFFIPFYVPSFLLKLVYGELSIEALKSATVSCKKIIDAGFSFKFPTLKAALEDLC